MMLKELRDEVYEANMDLPKHGLVVFTWGNASGLDRERGLFVIKPSGVSYEELSPENLVICDLDGNVVEGESIFRYSNSCMFVSRMGREDRRNCSHSLNPRCFLGTGRTLYSLLWHHTRRLFLRRHSLRAQPYQGRGRKCL